MWYKVDIKKLGVLFLPTFLRKPILLAYLEIVLHPISKIYDRWSVSRINNIYNLEHTGQVCYLRKALNDALDPGLRRIYIDNGNRFERRYIYTPAENETRFLEPLAFIRVWTIRIPE